VKKLALLVLVIVVLGAAASAAGAQPPAQEGFVPVDQLPGQEQLPAAPLVAAAYGVAWGAVLVYVWTVWRRLAKVEQELTEVSRRIPASGGRR
jgi:CcmD family protein